jgi:signal transduction histidine kinase
VLDFIRASLPATIEIERKIESEAYVVGDATQIYQILMNLCTNAGFAMRKRGGLLKINLSEIELDAATVAPYPEMIPGRYIKLRVSDTGSGMTPEIKERIFDPFFTTKEKGKGTGMGLSLSYDIIKSYGSNITVESAPGQGRFSLCISRPLRMQQSQPKSIGTPTCLEEMKEFYSSMMKTPWPIWANR